MDQQTVANPAHEEMPVAPREVLPRALAMFNAAETVKQTGGAVQIAGVKIEPCDEYGNTATSLRADRAGKAYSRALDEIWFLRRLCAYTAMAVAADLSMKTFPKSRRSLAEARIEDLRGAARGHAEVAIAGKSSQVMRFAMQEAGAGEMLTADQFEKEKGL